MDDESFAKAVEDGLKLSKRIYASKDRTTSAPPKTTMDRSPTSVHHYLLPTAPTVYAVIYDPAIVDNPDIPSYQPHVYGRCDPPALIPLQMKEIEVHVDCHVDTAVVAVRGRWRVHCVMGSRSCDCRLVVPTSEQGCILGVEVDVAKRSYSTKVIQREEDQKMDMIESGGLLKPQLFFITIPQVDGGCDISLKVSWSQKLLYKDGQFTISVPFHFPDYVTPFAKILSKREKIQLNVNTSTGKEVVIQRTSHAFKEEHRNVGKMSFLYEAEVEHWSTKDFHFSYSVYSSDVFGGILFQSPPMHDYDQREMFYLYLFPGNNPAIKVFRKEVVILVDISGSMQGKPLESVKNAISSALLELTSGGYFNIIAFNEGMHLFSSSLVPATENMVGNATHWISKNFVAEGGTNILQPLDQAMALLSKNRESLPHIFLITDGSVEGEREICCAMRTHVTNRGSMAPRISTFGIGSYCNHYFLRMLSSIGRGQYEAAYDTDSIEVQMHRWFSRGLSPVLTNVTVDILDHLEVYHSNIPDLSLGCPLVVSGRYEGRFPDSAKAKGSLADMSDIFVDLKVQNAKDIPLDKITEKVIFTRRIEQITEKIVAKQQIDLLTAQAWFSESKQLEEKVIKQSMQSGIISEYTEMVLLRHETEKQDGPKKQEKHKQGKTKDQAIILVHEMKLGFGNVTATAENLPTGFGQLKPPETFYVLNKAVGCCSRLSDCCCCMCFIQTCSKLNDQCVIAMTQLCTALSCFACLECCTDLCCSDGSN